MQGFTYSELEQALKDWGDNTSEEIGEFVDNIPRIVQLAELRVVMDLNLDIFDVTDTSAVVTNGSPLVAKPAGLITTRALWYYLNGARQSRITQRSYDWVTSYGMAGQVNGIPKYFCEQSDVSWLVAPTPNANATLESRGVYRPASLFDEETTWLGENCGQLIFVAAQLEADNYLKMDDRGEAIRSMYYNELLPVARMELRSLIRAGDYAPYRPAAQKAE